MIDLLYYDIGTDVEAFSTKKGSDLPYNVLQPHQVHGDSVAIIDDRQLTRENLRGIDALVTNLDDFPIGVRSADCVPILLYDPVNSVIAAIHSGWRGTVKRISQKTIDVLVDNFKTNPEDLRAVIGPSIGPESFEVRVDVVNSFCEAGFNMAEICKQKNEDKYLIDLWKANIFLLREKRVQLQNIMLTGICSFINHEEFYSARYESDNKCGRTINAIKINRKK